MSPPPAQSDVSDHVCSRLVKALLQADAARATAVVELAITAGLPVAAVYLDVITPAMTEVGLRWERGEITVTEEHLATAITLRIVAGLAPRLRLDTTAPSRRRVAVCGCAPNELHGLGARMIGDFLTAAGWTVYELGPATPAQSFAAAARTHNAPVVIVSTALASHLDGVRDVRRALDTLDDPPLLVVGGNAYADKPGLAAEVGADLYAVNPAALIAELEVHQGPRVT